MLLFTVINSLIKNILVGYSYKNATSILKTACVLSTRPRVLAFLYAVTA